MNDSPGPEHHPEGQPETSTGIRPWIVAAGVWQASCWALVLVSIVVGSFQLGSLAFIGLFPLYFVWRFRYMRAAIADPANSPLKRGLNRGFTAMAIGFFYPMTDAVKEVRGQPVL